jgi:hypothetical protein
VCQKSVHTATRHTGTKRGETKMNNDEIRDLIEGYKLRKATELAARLAKQKRE